jgi:hypothetical protein
MKKIVLKKKPKKKLTLKKKDIHDQNSLNRYIHKNKLQNGYNLKLDDKLKELIDTNEDIMTIYDYHEVYRAINY